MFCLCILTASLSAQRLNLQEGRFFTDNIPNTVTNVNNLTGLDDTTDSGLLNTIINNVSNSGGGTIVLGPHNGNSKFYFRDVKLKSNVHLKIEPSVTIEPTYDGIALTKNVIVFDIGNTELVENVSITSSNETSTKKSGAFKAILPGGKDRGVKLIEIGYARNFRISGISITDSYSKFSNIVLNLPNSKSKIDIAIKGKVENVYSVNNHAGYGIIQAQAAKTVLFKNLNGTGGVTLRLESGALDLNIDNVQTIDDVVGKKIRVTKGDAAVTLSPHRVNQGQVDITGIKAIKSTYAVRVAAGFLDDKDGDLDNLGTFDENSYLKVVRIIGGNPAQVKGKDFQFYNCASRAILKDSFDNGGRNPDGESVSGLSLAIYRDNADVNNGCIETGPDANGCYRPTTILPNSNKITGAFERIGASRDFVYNSHKIGGCWNASSRQANILEEKEFSIYPNPAKHTLQIRAEGKVIIYNTIGTIVKQIDVKEGESIIDISDLRSGLYIVTNEKYETKKLIID